jgi:hypothetical protein
MSSGRRPGSPQPRPTAWGNCLQAEGLAALSPGQRPGETTGLIAVAGGIPAVAGEPIGNAWSGSQASGLQPHQCRRPQAVGLGLGRPGLRPEDTDAIPPRVHSLSRSIPQLRVPHLDATIIFIGSGCLVCLMPLAVYLLYLSYLNGRPMPTMISGPWDFAAVLLGLAGFLIMLGPMLITLIDSTWRANVFGGWATLRSVGRREALAGSIMATGYFFILIGTILLLLRARKRVTAIYNVEAGRVESALTGLLDERGYPWRRNQGRIEIGVKKTAEPPEPAARFFPHETATVRVDSFAGLGHATLKWGGAWINVRSEIETDLIGLLPSYRAGRNPIAGWMFTAAMTVMIVMLLWLVVMIYLMVTPPPG